MAKYHVVAIFEDDPLEHTADFMAIGEQGELNFYDSFGNQLVVMYPPGQWLRVYRVDADGRMI